VRQFKEDYAEVREICEPLLRDAPPAGA